MGQPLAMRWSVGASQGSGSTSFILAVCLRAYVYVAADDVYLWIGDIHKAWRTVPMRFTDLMAGDAKGRSRLPLEAAADPIRSTQRAQADHAPRRCAGP